MLKKILVTLDGSALSEQALPVARELLDGSHTNATLFVVGDAPDAAGARRRGVGGPFPITIGGAGTFVPGVTPLPSPEFAETKGQAVERREHELLEYLNEVGQQLLGEGRSLDAAVRLGDAAREIISFAKRGGYELIVMATHGRSGLRETLQGSVTAEVIRSGVAPVLVVRPKAGKKRS